MLGGLYYFSSTAVSEQGVPLPIDDTENVLFLCDNVYFRFSAKHSARSAQSPSGRLYLTTHRIVYIPSSKEHFSSFFVPLNKIFDVEPGSILECLCENKYIGVIELNLKSYQSGALFAQIKEAVDRVVLDVDPAFIADDDDEVPYYTDIVD